MIINKMHSAGLDATDFCLQAFESSWQKFYLANKGVLEN